MSLEQPEFFQLFLASSWVQVILLYKQLFFSPHTDTQKSGIIPELFQPVWAMFEKGWAPTGSFICFFPPSACHFSKQIQFGKGFLWELLWAFYFRGGKMNNSFPFPLWHANSLTFTHYANFKEEAVSMSENQQWQ